MTRHCLLILLCLALNSCSSELMWPTSLPKVRQAIRQQFPDVNHLSTADLSAWLADAHRPVPLIIDARAQDEFAVSHIPAATNLPYRADLSPILRASSSPSLGTPGEVGGGGLPPHPKTPRCQVLQKDHPIVVYCSVGYRSSILARRLQRSGFRDVYNLDGSIFQWAAEDRLLLSAEGRETRKVHPFNHNWARILPASSQSDPAPAAATDIPRPR